MQGLVRIMWEVVLLKIQLSDLGTTATNNLSQITHFTYHTCVNENFKARRFSQPLAGNLRAEKTMVIAGIRTLDLLTHDS